MERRTPRSAAGVFFLKAGRHRTDHRHGIELATDIADTAEFFYRHDPDASSRRVKEERWGVVFESTAEPVVPPVPPVP